MQLSELSIRRPVFITCLAILLLTIGYISLKKMPVDLFPNVTFPVILIHTHYPGASPEEVETLVSKVIENELNNIAGIKKLGSDSTEGASQVIAEFTADTDIKYAEQQVRDKISAIKRKLPSDVEEPSIKRIDPADKPIVILSLQGALSRHALYELADDVIKPKLEQLNQVGLVETLGSSGREIHVDLDRHKLLDRDISASEVVNRIANAGENIPVGKIDQGKQEKIFRSIGEYQAVKDIGNVVLRFTGNDIPVTVSSVATVTDSVAEEHSKTYVNGKPSVLLMVFRQNGTNTIEVVNAIKKKISGINAELHAQHPPVAVTVVRDGAKMIHENVNDVVESILIGTVLTIAVVFLFLGSVRSTIITGLALPTSLIGSFFLMRLAGFSINTMSLLALSLAVGLLVDDAIVVRENIFRHNEMGQNRIQAAISGTKEVLLAVIATSMTVIAVFGPIGFLHGVVGSFFKEFGLTVCFAMIISLFDAITMAPMLSAYIGLGQVTHRRNKVLSTIQRFQTRLEERYARILKTVLHFPLTVLLLALFIFILSLFATKFVPKTFLPASDTGDFMVSLELPPGANLQAMDDASKKINQKILSNPEVATTVAIVGAHGEPNRAHFYVNMVQSKQRHLTTTQFKRKLRHQLKQFKPIKIVVKEIDLVGGGERPFNLNISGGNLNDLKAVAFKIYEKLKHHPGLVDPEISYKPGKPEMQILPDKLLLQKLGVFTTTMGQELRTQIEGTKAAVYRTNGSEYDIRVRLQPDQRDLEKYFQDTYIPNVNNSLIRLRDVAKPVQSNAPSAISHKDRKRDIQISADVAPDGPGLGGVMNDIETLFKTNVKLPPGVSYSFEGQAESFTELKSNMLIALCLGILFIYLVLASLYESFVTPLTIMLVLPLAACGAFFALLITQHSLDIFSMIGCILLFGIATKNSILLVDYTRQLRRDGVPREQAIIQAGKTRLRPILMTTIALIAGMLPIAIGLNEASKQRTSMGIAVIGGLISSTLLTLVVVPAAYAYVERFGAWCKRILNHERKASASSSKEALET